MNLWLCRKPLKMYGGRYSITNYCPYRSPTGDSIEDLWFWYPFWLGGRSWSQQVETGEVEALGGEIPYGSCKNLATGEIIEYKDLLPFENHELLRYYDFGVGSSTVKRG